MRAALKRWWMASTAIVTFWRLARATAARRRAEADYAAILTAVRTQPALRVDDWQDQLPLRAALRRRRESAADVLMRRCEAETVLALRLRGRT